MNKGQKRTLIWPSLVGITILFQSLALLKIRICIPFSTVTIEMHILPRLGSRVISDDAITALARAVRDGSRLHEISQDTTSSSPAMTLNGSADSFARSEDHVSMTSSGDLDGTTIGESELPRERFAYWCFDLLFLMCQRGSPHTNEPGEPFASLVRAAIPSNRYCACPL